MSISFGVPRRRRRRPPPQSRPLRPRPRRRRPQLRRLLLPPRPLLPQMRRLLAHRPRRLPQLHRLPLQVHRFQRRVATRGALPLQSRQPTVARRGRIAIPGLVAAHHSKTIARASKTIARAPSRTSYQKGSAAIPAWRGRVPVASAVAPGAVVNTELLPRHLPFLPSERGDESLEPPPRRAYWKAVSEKFLSLRECSRSIGMSANFSIALMPMVRCWATCRL